MMRIHSSSPKTQQEQTFNTVAITAAVHFCATPTHLYNGAEVPPKRSHAILGPHAKQDGRHKAQHKLRHEDQEDELVDHLVHVALLGGRGTLVLHQLRVSAREDDQTDHPLATENIPQRR